MTFRKDLRDAELAVITAAEAMFGDWPDALEHADFRHTTVHGKPLGDMLRGLDAVRRLRSQLDADASPHSHSDTSANAANRMVPLAGSLRRSILIELYRRRNHPTPGASDDKLERALGRPHTSVSAARKFLYDTGWVVDSGARAETRAGREAIVWVLAPGSTEALVAQIAGYDNG